MPGMVIVAYLVVAYYLVSGNLSGIRRYGYASMIGQYGCCPPMLVGWCHGVIFCVATDSCLLSVVPCFPFFVLSRRLLPLLLSAFFIFSSFPRLFPFSSAIDYTFIYPPVLYYSLYT